MFYLSKFFFLFKKYPWRLGLFSLGLFLFLSSLFNEQSFNKIVSMFFGGGRPRPFFTAVLINTSLTQESLNQKLANLPGVELLEFTNDKSLKEKVVNHINSDELKIPDLFLRQEVLGLKVFFKVDTSAKSIELIREYLIRLSGKDSITPSPIQYEKPRFNFKNEKIAAFIENFGPFLFYLIEGILLLFFYMFIRNPINLVSYLIEEYQRKKYVAVKISATGLLGLYGIFCLILTLFTDPSWKEYLWGIILIGFLVTTHIKYGHETIEKY